MPYQPGQEIAIKSAHVICNSCHFNNGALHPPNDGAIVFSDNMRQYCGRTTMIRSVENNGRIIRLEIDEGINIWSPTWLESVVNREQV